MKKAFSTFYEKLLVGIVSILLMGGLFIACNRTETTAPPATPNWELIPEPDKHFRLAYEKTADSLAKLAPTTPTAPAAAPEKVATSDSASMAVPPPFEITGEVPDRWAAYLDRAKRIDQLGPDPEPNIDAIYYYIADDLVKIETFWKGQIEGYQETYYVTEDEPFLIRERYTRLNDEGKTEEYEDLNFLENGRLLRRFEAGDCGAPFARDYLDEVEASLMQAYRALR